jgi:transcription elongation factor Elf1
MGGKKAKRRAKQPAPKTRRFGKLEKVFECPICSHEKSVDCKLDRQRGIGSLLCRVCGVEYQADINPLSQAVDVYSAWIDAFEAANPTSIQTQEQ